MNAKRIDQIVLLIFLLLVISLPVLMYFGAVNSAAVWNRCHPSAPITAKEAFFVSPEIILCETGVLKEQP